MEIGKWHPEGVKITQRRQDAKDRNEKIGLNPDFCISMVARTGIAPVGLLRVEAEDNFVVPKRASFDANGP